MSEEKVMSATASPKAPGVLFLERFVTDGVAVSAPPQPVAALFVERFVTGGVATSSTPPCPMVFGRWTGKVGGSVGSAFSLHVMPREGPLGTPPPSSW